jgi:hypothetical protein
VHVTPPLFLNAQSAFSFDGINDFIEYNPNPATVFFDDESASTIEVIFQIDQMKHQVILSQTNGSTGNLTELGINVNGNIYTVIAGNQYTAGEEYLETDECYHLSVVYGVDLITFYLNGNVISTLSRSSSLPDFTVNSPFYMGKTQVNRNTNFSGTMDELRIFSDARTDTEINTFLFQPLTLANDNLLACFNFSTWVSGITHGAFNNHNLGILGGAEVAYSPSWTEEICIGPISESVNPFCAANTPSCSTAGLPPSEMLCNGDFEQFCPALYINHSTWNGSFPTWLRPNHAFMQSNTSVGASGSDVSNWDPSSVSGALTSPDFFVRDGVGSPTGFAPIWSISSGNWISNPPTNTWNGLGNAVVGLHGANTTAPTTGVEGIVTVLNSALQPSTTYQFSGWFYKTDINGGSGGSGSLALEFSNGTTSFTPGSVSIPNWSSQASSINNWYYGALTFTTGSSIPLNLTTLKIQHNAIATGDYVFLDNLSLKSIIPQGFPQYFYTVDHNDYHHRRVKTDANNNVYVIAAIENVNSSGGSQTGTLGLPMANTFSINADFSSLIIKYDQYGQYLWHRHYDHLVLIDFDFDSNGNIVAVGHTENGDQWSGINYTGPNTGFTTTCTPPNSVSKTAYETQQLLLYRVNSNTGNTISSYAQGGRGWESGVGIHIDGNTAYILTKLELGGICSSNSFPPSLSWNSPISTSHLLRFNLQSNTPGSPVTAVNAPQLIKGDGNKLYVLRNDGNLDKITITGASTHTTISTSITADATYLQPSHDGTNLFVSYRMNNLGSNIDGKVERRNASNLNLVSSFTTTKMPMAIASGSNGDYVLYRQNSSGTSPGKVLGVEKLDLANFGTPLWTKESAQHQGNILNNYKTYGYEVMSDMAAYQNNSTKTAILGSFQTTSSPWVIGFDANTLSGTLQGVGNCVVLNITDNGTSANFKKEPTQEDSLDTSSLAGFNLYPNPASGNMSLESDQPFSEVFIYNLNGQIVQSQKMTATQRIELNLENLNAGLYLIKVKTEQGYQHKKFILE